MEQYNELKKIIEAQSKLITELQNQVKILTGAKETTVSETHKQAWEWAKKEGLLNGQKPGQALTREQFATVLYRQANK